jgi:hypothetical protein
VSGSGQPVCTHEAQVPADQVDPLLHAGGGAERVARGLFTVVDQLLDGRRRDVAAGVAGGVVNQDMAIRSEESKNLEETFLLVSSFQVLL